MTELSPRVAAELAKEVYFVQDEKRLPFFLARPEFSTNTADKRHLEASVGGRLLRSARDGFGVCAFGAGGHDKEIFLVFRGSTSANRNADWVSNARIGLQFSSNGLPVHLGFNQIFTSMLPAIRDFLGSQPGATGTIHCIGHSLGGAVATLAADWASGNRVNPVRLYTFGAPRPGLTLFASNLSRKLGKDRIYRTYHATDPVPMIPLFPFVHPPLPGYGHFIPSSEAILSAEAHDMSRYVASVRDSSWKELQRRAPPYHADHAIEEWLKSTFPVNAASPKIWHWINAALVYVLRKILGVGAVMLQGVFMGAFTLADSIAWMLRKGIDLGERIGVWVQHLMRKIMQALGMRIARSRDDLTRDLMRRVLTHLMQRTAEEARRAIQRSSIR